MVDVEFRAATRADADELAAVYRSAYRENRELGFPTKAGSVKPGTVAEWIRKNQVFVATIESEVVGGVRLEETDPNRVKLSRLGVREDRKGNGIGSDLVAHAENCVRERGCDVVWLTTPEGHPYLPDFYRRRGYEKMAPYPLEYREYDEIVMEKQLR